MKLRILAVVLLVIAATATIWPLAADKTEPNDSLPIWSADSDGDGASVPYTVTGVPLTGAEGHIVNDLLAPPAEAKIVSFFFSSCTTICPVVNHHLNRLSERFVGTSVLLHSVSVDPAADTPAVLQQYRADHRYHRGNWRFYSGTPKDILTLAANCRLKAFETDPGAPFMHDPIVVLLDRRNRIRGYYNGLREDDMKKLMADTARLLEAAS